MDLEDVTVQYCIDAFESEGIVTLIDDGCVSGFAKEKYPASD